MRLLLLATATLAASWAQDTTGNIYGATDPPVYFPTTVASTSQAPTTVKQTTTTTRQPTTTTKQQTTRPTASPPTNNGPQCQCNTSTVWIDVMFLLDGSSAGGQQGLEEIWSLVGTSLDFFTVQKTGYTGSNYTTRVGIITYGAGVTVYRSLGNVTNDDLDYIDPSDLPYYAGDTTNLEGAMQAAMDQFATSNHRANAKEVIVVVATTYNPTGVTAPQQVATQFKESGGILVIYNYVPEHGAVSGTLEEIASPGYFLINIAPQNDTYLDLNQALCDANCFCGLNYKSYTNSYRQTPTDGCYQPVSLTANNRLAGIKCADFNGYLTSDQSQDKSAFLSNLIHENVFWLGLTYTNQWRWADNSSLGAYQPWATGVAPNGGCVYVGDQLKWYGTDCRNGYNYICEAFPCDALHYCP